MIYSVVPAELAPELYDKLVEYYKDDPNVTVIVDRRKASRRNASSPPTEEDLQRREIRDRRRARVPGDLPGVDAG